MVTKDDKIFHPINQKIKKGYKIIGKFFYKRQ